MSGRLDKLLHQRELVREHLRWLEDEIAAATDSTDQPSAPAPAAPIAVTSPATLVAADATVTGPSTGDSALPDPDSSNLHSEVRNGCLLYFGIAFAAFGLLVAFIYWRY